MAKNKTIFVCSGCGYESPNWMGKCPACNEWNSFYEEKVISNSSTKAGAKKAPRRRGLSVHRRPASGGKAEAGSDPSGVHWTGKPHFRC